MTLEILTAIHILIIPISLFSVASLRFFWPLPEFSKVYFLVLIIRNYEEAVLSWLFSLSNSIDYRDDQLVK